MPYFEGERTPDLPDATATLSGLTLASTTRENLARAAVEGMLSALADGAAAVRDQGVERRARERVRFRLRRIGEERGCAGEGPRVSGWAEISMAHPLADAPQNAHILWHGH